MNQLKLFEGEVHEDDSSNIDPIAEINRLQIEARIRGGEIDPSNVPAVVRFNATPKDESELAEIIEFRRRFEGPLAQNKGIADKQWVREETD